jgi:hypothetical protein
MHELPDFPRGSRDEEADAEVDELEVTSFETGPPTPPNLSATTGRRTGRAASGAPKPPIRPRPARATAPSTHRPRSADPEPGQTNPREPIRIGSRGLPASSKPPVWCPERAIYGVLIHLTACERSVISLANHCGRQHLCSGLPFVYHQFTALVMDAKEIATSVIAGAILGLGGAFFAFQGRVSRLETTVEQLRSGGVVAVQLRDTATAKPAQELRDGGTRSLAEAQPGAVLLGPIDGVLQPVGEDAISSSSAGVRVRNFIAQARFYNPASPEAGSWSAGIGFRDTGTNQEYRLSINSEKEWWLEHVTPGADSSAVFRTVGRGRVEAMNISPEGTNLITIKVKDYQGVFSLNDRAVTMLSLSAKDAAGDVMVRSRLQPGDQALPVRFEGFTVWELQ